jgi:predicted amidohydrolase
MVQMKCIVKFILHQTKFSIGELQAETQYRPLTPTAENRNRDLLRCGISRAFSPHGRPGMNILFVPFLTDTQNGYTRVKHCAQARAIENECYVAIAGCVGNLPKVNNMDIQYAQAAVYTV